MSILKYEDKDYEVLIEKSVYIKDKSTNEYYRVEKSELSQNLIEQSKLYKEKISKNIFILYCITLLCLISINYVSLTYLQKKFTYSVCDFKKGIVIFIYFVFNIFFHELAHIKSLAYFGKIYNRIGFKLTFYVFPSFYVQMNELYLLSKKEKFLVHSFGIFTNYLFINIFQLINILSINNSLLTFAFMLFSTTLFWNMIPILNSDGYKLLITILNIDEFSSIKVNNWIVLILQGIGVCIALNTVFNWVSYFASLIN